MNLMIKCVMIFRSARQAQGSVVVQEGAATSQQQPGSSPGGGAVHVQMMDSQQIIKYEIIEAPSPTGGNGTNTVTVSTGQSGSVVTSNGSADGNTSDQMD